jgi:hypothetical protein
MAAAGLLKEMPSQTAVSFYRRKASPSASVSRFHLIFTVYAAASAARCAQSPVAPVPAVGEHCAQAFAVEGVIFEHRNADMLDPRAKPPHQNGNGPARPPDCCGAAVTLLPDPGRSIG